MTTFTITPRGPFSLAAAERFFGRWEAAAGTHAEDGVPLRVAFLVDDFSGAAGLTVHQTEDGAVRAELVSGTFADPAPIRPQLERLFSLDHDATGYVRLGTQDPVIATRQRDADFLRPVLFHSPYEAACWTILSARVHHTQARRIRSALSDRLEVDGTALEVFPGPHQLLALDVIPGLSTEKISRLHGIARAALEGALDRERLLGLDPPEAMAELQQLRGIGPFSAALVVLRGVGPTDALADGEPGLRRAVAAAYGRPELAIDDGAFVELAERWRPYRTWVSVLLRATMTGHH